MSRRLRACDNAPVSEQSGKLSVECPDCGCEIVVDVASGQVLFHQPAKKAPAEGKDFDSLLAGLGASKAKADEVFNREFSALKDRDRVLEEKFKEALKRAEETDDGAPPVRPWDLD